jgi:hypothetical protein
MTKKNTDAVAVAATDAGVPAYLQKYEGGAVLKDNFGSEDIVLPQLKLMQGVSEQIGVYDDAKVGNWWFTGLDEDAGSELEFVVVSRRKMYLLSAPMDDGQGIFARSEDAITWDRTGSWTVQVDKKTKAIWEITDLNVEKSGLTNWGTYDPEDENSPPAATLFYQYVVLVPAHPEWGAAALSFSRSAVKHVKKQLNSKISLHASNGRPLQSIKFKLKVGTEQNGSNQDYHVPQFASGGFADEATFHQALKMAETLTSYRVEGEGDDDSAKPASGKASDEY